MKKMLSAVLGLLFTLTVLVSCQTGPVQAGSDTEEPTADVTVSAEPLTAAGIAASVAVGASFTESAELFENNEYFASAFLQPRGLADRVVSYDAYVSASVTTQEIFVMEAKTEEDTKAIVAQIEEYINQQRDLYGSYAKGETPRLEDAVIAVNGCFVVYVASEDNDAAADLVQSLFAHAAK